jgi:hypothetical protein
VCPYLVLLQALLAIGRLSDTNAAGSKLEASPARASDNTTTTAIFVTPKMRA